MATHTFDELLTHLGMSWWNFMYIAALSLRLMLHPSQSISVVYLAPWQDHICVPDTAHLNVTVSREACHYVIERPVTEAGGGDGGGGEGYEGRGGEMELLEVPCTQWDFNTTTFTSTLTSEFEWVCEKEYLRATYQGAYMLGTATAPLLSGYLADRFGRMRVLVASHVALSVTSISLCFLHSVPLILLFRFFNGSSELMTGLVLTLEVCEPRHRAAVGVLSGLAWSVGTVLWGGLAFFIRAWRPLQLAASLPTILAFPLLYFMDESPRWLIVQGRSKRAMRVLEKAAKWNKRPLPPQTQLDDLFSRIYKEEEKGTKKIYNEKLKEGDTKEDVGMMIYSKDTDQARMKMKEDEERRICHVEAKEKDEEGRIMGNEETDAKKERSRTSEDAKGVRKPFLKRPRLCLNTNIALVTLVNCLCYFCVALVFDGLNLAGDLYSDNVFLYLILGGLVEVPGIIFAAPLIHHLGRKGPFLASLLGCGVVNVALSFIPAAHLTASLIVAMMGKLLVCAAFQILYVYSNELFPTEVRVSGVEGACAVGQVGALVAPYFSTYLGPLFPWLPSAVYGTLSIMTAFAGLLLRETKDHPLPETIADLNNLALVKHRSRRESCTNNDLDEGLRLSK